MIRMMEVLMLTTAAPPNPWMTRMAMSMRNESAKAQPIDAIVKRSSPPM